MNSSLASAVVLEVTQSNSCQTSQLESSTSNCTAKEIETKVATILLQNELKSFLKQNFYSQLPAIATQLKDLIKLVAQILGTWGAQTHGIPCHNYQLASYWEAFVIAEGPLGSLERFKSRKFLLIINCCDGVRTVDP